MSWGALALMIRRWDEPIVYGLVPLVVLITGFESALALHVGVERIGQYLAVFYEASPGMPKWETAIATFGRTAPRRSAQPHVLLAAEFIAATAINLVLAIEIDGSALPEGIGMAVFHAAFIVRVVRALRQARRQREVDASAFRAIAQDYGP